MATFEEIKAQQQVPKQGVSFDEARSAPPTPVTKTNEDDRTKFQQFRAGYWKGLKSTAYDYGESAVKQYRHPKEFEEIEEGFEEIQKELIGKTYWEKFGKGAEFATEILAPTGFVGMKIKQSINALKKAPSMIYRALKVSKATFPRFRQTLSKALDEITKVGAPIRNLDSLDKTVDIAKGRIWENITNRITDTKGATVNGELIYGKIMEVLKDNKKMFFENPDLSSDVLDTALRYKKSKLTVPEAEAFLEEANAFLQAFYRKNPIMSSVKNAQLKVKMNLKIAEALRFEIDRTTKLAGGEGVGELKKSYGALSEFSKAVKARIPVEQRLAHFNLSEQLNYPEATGKFLKSVFNFNWGDAGEQLIRIGLTRKIKNMNKTDSLIEKAFKQLNDNASKYESFQKKEKSIFSIFKNQ